MEALVAEGRAPSTIVLENVSGLLTAGSGADFAEIAGAFARASYLFGALEIDAAWFTPQSRPRVFLVATRAEPPRRLHRAGPTPPFHSTAVQAAAARLPEPTRNAWRWWSLPEPPRRNTTLSAILEDDPDDVCWNTAEKTARLLAQLSPLHQEKLAAIRAAKTPAVGAGYRRIRLVDGRKVQRFEVRFDGLAGCLRTPAGGSSRQILLFVDGAKTRSRLLSAREAARLMGLPDSYPLPGSHSRAMHLMGDGVCAPVAGWLGAHLLAPLAGVRLAPTEAAG
jgi:DNA (cytosine-5)-methyltransferase 1